MALLSVQDVTVRFGGILALDGISFDVPDGSIVGLIGPNGAGKTTLFNVVTRVYTPQSGQISFEGQSLLSVPPDAALPAFLPVALVRPALDRLARRDPFAPAELSPWRRQWLIWRAARNPARIAS